MKGRNDVNLCRELKYREVSERASQVDIWRRHMPRRWKASAKALRQAGTQQTWQLTEKKGKSPYSSG